MVAPLVERATRGERDADPLAGAAQAFVDLRQRIFPPERVLPADGVPAPGQRDGEAKILQPRGGGIASHAEQLHAVPAPMPDSAGRVPSGTPPFKGSGGTPTGPGEQSAGDAADAASAPVEPDAASVQPDDALTGEGTDTEAVAPAQPAPITTALAPLLVARGETAARVVFELIGDDPAMLRDVGRAFSDYHGARHAVATESSEPVRGLRAFGARWRSARRLLRGRTRLPRLGADAAEAIAIAGDRDPAVFDRVDATLTAQGRPVDYAQFRSEHDLALVARQRAEAAQPPPEPAPVEVELPPPPSPEQVVATNIAELSAATAAFAAASSEYERVENEAAPSTPDIVLSEVWRETRQRRSDLDWLIGAVRGERPLPPPAPPTSTPPCSSTTARWRRMRCAPMPA